MIKKFTSKPYTASRTQFDIYLCATEQFSELHNILDLCSGCSWLTSRPPYPLPWFLSIMALM